MQCKKNKLKSRNQIRVGKRLVCIEHVPCIYRSIVDSSYSTWSDPQHAAGTLRHVASTLHHAASTRWPREQRSDSPSLMGTKRTQGDVAHATSYAADSEGANSKIAEFDRPRVLNSRTKYSKIWNESRKREGYK